MNELKFRSVHQTMNGMIALLGSGEYLPVMNEVDAFLLAQSGVGDRKPRVICLPTAAGKEGPASIERWTRLGEEHFLHLNAEVEALPIIDRDSANDPRWQARIDQADLIYFSGGDPNFLYYTMAGSRAWEAASRAWQRGAGYAGCSAGAMILGGKIPDIRVAGLRSIKVFGIIPAVYVIPHFDAIPGFWKPVIQFLRRKLKKSECMIGIDENTAILGRVQAEWTVMGEGQAHVIRTDGNQDFRNGEQMILAA